ncbi:hypothetical protein MCNS_45900 [Mycobacterium conspicuum]|uniref:Uncharacterized protein n=1 Tax=Mycobacterium conspicuum TaxID=44010 RepID=A0A7I7YJK5_9MYCO|nr:hypothetical protein MCNS_45900 [Mycobacterium conspicuum]
MAAESNQLLYGAAASFIEIEDGPRQISIAKSEVTELNLLAAELNSVLMPFQAAAASRIGSAPGPSNICAELTSGGNIEKCNIDSAHEGRRA